ncbi:MAG: DUF4129 domain-containing protein [Chloroflexi bacterium]|nr:DUF4129 domain-containing protein [Chloroflexota bacterium]
MAKVNFKTYLGNWQRWGVIILVFLTLETSVLSIEQAQWITPQPSLTLVLAISVLTGWILSKSRLSGAVAHSLAMVLGVTITIWQAATLLTSPESTTRVGQLASDLQSWWQAVTAAEPSQGTIHFAVFLIFFTWIMGYVSTWYVLRRENAWIAVSLSGITILVNLGNLPKQQLDFFFFYTLAALLLIGMTNLAKHYYWFKKHGVIYPNRVGLFFMTLLVCLSLIAGSAAWDTSQGRFERLENVINSKTLWRKDVEKYFGNLLASVPTKQPFFGADDNSTLLFGDSSFDQGNELQFIVITEHPAYWRTRVYDNYSSWGWTSSAISERALKQGLSQLGNGDISKLSEITYEVVPKVTTDMVFTTGEFVSSDIPVSLHTLVPQSFSIDLDIPPPDTSVPPDVASFVQSLTSVRVSTGGVSPEVLQQLLPENLILNSFSASQSVGNEFTSEPSLVNTQPNTVEVTRRLGGNSNMVAVTSAYLLKSDQRYRVTTTISSATPEDLSKAGNNYPAAVTDYYLQLPQSLPARVKSLSETITKEAATPYDKVLTVKSYLSQLQYRLTVKAPPEGMHGVDHFLFIQKTGNCVQFASAMAVMLRSVGIPTRMATGYVPGEYDVTTGGFALTAKERHAWPEVYFPGYGWIGFEATPGVNSEGEVAPVESVAFQGEPIWLDWDSNQWREWLQWQSGLEPQEREEWLAIMGWGEEELEEWMSWLETQEQLDSNIVEQQLKASGATTDSPGKLGLILFFSISGIFVVATLWIVFRRRKKRFAKPDYAATIYYKMCRLASLGRLGPRPYQTPFEYCAGLSLAFPRQAEALDTIVQMYVERRYSSGQEMMLRERRKLQKSWRAVKRSLIKRLFRLKY